MSAHTQTWLRRGLVGVAVAASLLIPTATHVTRLLGAAAIHHARMSIHHNDDGTVKTGIRNEAETSNWSGYVVMNFVTGDTYSAAHVSWTVPEASFQQLPVTCHVTSSRRSTRQVCSSADTDTEYSSSWVGIGGTCENTNCTRTDNTLIQLGTEQDVNADGSTQYYAWYELLPRGSVTIGSCARASCAYRVQPGDAMSASLACTANCTPGESQSWLLTMTDATQKWTYSTTVKYASTLASAEWIEEAPSSSAGVLPLANFAKAAFDPTDNGNALPNFPNGANGTPGPDAIMMVDPYGETSAPSPAAGLDAFATCWGDSTSHIATCPAP